MVREGEMILRRGRIGHGGNPEVGVGMRRAKGGCSGPFAGKPAPTEDRV